MSRYINQDRVIDAVLNLDTSNRVSWQDAVIDMIDGMAPEDVQPVVHGVWIKIEYHTYRCSECGKSIITNCDYIREHKFCFRCGAKMDGKGVDNV